MTNVSCLLALVAAAVLVAVADAKFQFDDRDFLSEKSLRDLYKRWIHHHGDIVASRSPDDDVEERFSVFKENARFVHDFNRNGTRPYKLGLNQFGDTTDEEFARWYTGTMVGHQYSNRRLGRGRPRGSGEFMYADVDDAPPSMDWREKGAVTGVKYQGKCGSCWAFSTVAAIEGINQIAGNELISLSEQEVLDCDNAGSNNGCKGGRMVYAFDFVVNNGGITTETAYPYEGQQEICESSQNSNVVVIDGYENVPANDEGALLKAASNQPVSVAIEASGRPFKFYSEGVFTGDCGTKLNHGVVVVGYGTSDDGTDYWLVKNSWGTQWGEDGFVRMERGVSFNEGLCGIAMDASYPIKSSPNPKRR